MVLLSILLLDGWWSSRSDTLKILLAHQMILFYAEASFFYEVAEHPLKRDYNEWPFHLIHSTFEIVPECSLVILVRTGQKVHLKVLIILDGLLLGAVELLGVEAVCGARAFLLSLVSELDALAQVGHAVLGSDGLRILLLCLLKSNSLS